MDVIIDGHNLAHDMYFHKLSKELALDEMLIKDVARYALLSGKQCLMVFDSRKVVEAEAHGHVRDAVQWIYAPDADEEIRRRLAIIQNPADTLVVSTDKEIYLFARDLGFQVRKSHQFSDQVRYWETDGTPPLWTRITRRYKTWRWLTKNSMRRRKKQRGRRRGTLKRALQQTLGRQIKGRWRRLKKRYST